MSLHFENQAGLDIQLLRSDGAEIWNFINDNTQPGNIYVPFPDLDWDIQWVLRHLGRFRCQGGITWQDQVMTFDRGNLPENELTIRLRVIANDKIQPDQCDNHDQIRLPWSGSRRDFWNQNRVFVKFTVQNPPWMPPN